MTEYFTDVLLEIFINGAWTDISADVMAEPRPHWNVGKMSNGYDSHVGDPEILTFSLKNPDGRYSPGHASMTTGWRTGLQVRLGFVYDSSTVYKYKGVIKPDGIIVTPNTKGPRRVDVTCYGFMGRAAEHNLDLVSIVESVTLEGAVQNILANMPIAPGSTEYGTGQSTFTTFFDTVSTGTSAVSEMDKAALSEMGWVTTTDGDNLVTFGRDDLANIANSPIPESSSVSGYALLQGGGYKLLQGGGKVIINKASTASFSNVFIDDSMELAYGKNYVNQVKTNAYPRRVDAAATTVLWSLETAIEIPASTTITPKTRGTYRNPTGGAKTVKGREFVDPLVSGTDFTANSQQNGGGTNQTANMSLTATIGTAEISIDSITNASGASIWTGGDAGTLQVRGKGIYFDDVASNVVDDEALQAADGLRTIEFDFKYQDNPLVTKDFANFYLSLNSVKRTTIERCSILANRDTNTMNAFLYLRPFTRARFVETQAAIDEDFFVVGYEAEIVPAVQNRVLVVWSPVLMRAADFDFSLWENGYERKTETFPTSTYTDWIFTPTGYNNGAANQFVESYLGHTGIAGFASGAHASSSGGLLAYATPYYTVTDGALDFSFTFCQRSNTAAGFAGMSSGDLSGFKGAYFRLSGTRVIDGYCFEGAGSSTGTSYTISLDTWYKATMHINQAGTLVTFTLYNDYDAVLWTDTITTNIPASSTALYPCFNYSYNTTPSLSDTLMYLDYSTFGYKHD